MAWPDADLHLAESLLVVGEQEEAIGAGERGLQSALVAEVGLSVDDSGQRLGPSMMKQSARGRPGVREEPHELATDGARAASNRDDHGVRLTSQGRPQATSSGERRKCSPSWP